MIAQADNQGWDSLVLCCLILLTRIRRGLVKQLPQLQTFSTASIAAADTQ